jgi:hypothetical protein
MKVGAPSQEAVVETKQPCYFFNKRGIYETVGGYPRKISRRIKDIIDAIPASYYSSVSSWGDNERIYFSIGDITLGDLNLTNCVVAYSIDSQVWTLLSFPFEIKRWHHYIDSNDDETIIAGDDDGNVRKILDGSDDSGTMINWLLQYQVMEFGSRGRQKDISKLVVYSKNVQSGTVSCRVEEAGNFNPVGNVKENVQEITKDINGRYFEFRIQGQGKSVEIIGIDFPEANLNISYGK